MCRQVQQAGRLLLHRVGRLLLHRVGRLCRLPRLPHHMAPIPKDQTMDRIPRVQTMDLTPRVRDFCNRLHIHRLHIHRLHIARPHPRPRHQHLKNKKTSLLTIQRHLAPTSDVAQVLGHLPPPRPRPLPPHRHLLLNTTNNSLCLT